MAKYRLRRKSFGLGNAIGTLAKKTWGTGIGKTAIIGGGIAAAGS
jgi:hypothetical protein|nr:MAG TPA: FAD-NAD(P)-binding [Bacteriophage sp.]